MDPEQTELLTDESQVGLHQESIVCLTDKLQVPIREFSIIIRPQVSTCAKYMGHSSSGLHVLVNHAVFLASEGNLERKIATYYSMFSDIGFVTSMVNHFSSENVL
jgi:hypothetical protein